MFASVPITMTVVVKVSLMLAVEVLPEPAAFWAVSLSVADEERGVPRPRESPMVEAEVLVLSQPNCWQDRDGEA